MSPVATLVASIGFCTPSFVYRSLFAASRRQAMEGKLSASLFA